MAGPEFFLSSAGDYKGLSQPRACWRKSRLRDPVRDDYMLVEIEPALIGQPFGLGDQDIFQLLLSSRYEGFSLFPINKWPCPVYVARILDNAILQTRSFTKGQVELIAWANIFPTMQEAESYARKWDDDAAV